MEKVKYIKIAPNARTSFSDVLKTQKTHIEDLLKEFPNPKSGARPINYKLKKNDDGAVERAKECIDSMLSDFEESKHIKILDFKYFYKIYPIYCIYFNHQHSKGMKTTKAQEDKFVSNCFKGVLEF